jgi:hypothetical protein
MLFLALARLPLHLMTVAHTAFELATEWQRHGHLRDSATLVETLELLEAIHVGNSNGGGEVTTHQPPRFKDALSKLSSLTRSHL